MKNFDYWLEWSASEGKPFPGDAFKELDTVEEPTQEELEEIEEELKRKGWVVK